MVECICMELQQQEHFTSDPIIETIYFGGGTPSLLSKKELSVIMHSLQQHFTLDEKVEITLEVNPDDVSPLQLNDWLQAGINRLSVGIQSFSEDELRWMNRAHTGDDAIRCLKEITASGFSDFSADLIYGSPFLTQELLEKNVEMMAAFSVPHLSCYALTVEQKTALHHQVHAKKNIIINDQHQSEQFLWLMEHLPGIGYEQYEISNFARAGHRSKHNSSYWQGKPYYGFGPSAHAYDGKHRRSWNMANNTLYMEAIEKNLPVKEEELLTTTQQLHELVMIALRTAEGIDLQVVEKRFSQTGRQQILKAAQPYISTGKLIMENDTLQLTNEGKIFADGIAAALFV